MGEVLLPELFIVQEFERKVGEKSSIGKVMVSQVDFPSGSVVVDVILSPFLLPLQGKEGGGEGASHLDCLADRQVGSGLVIEESLDLVVQIDRGASELHADEVVVLFESQLL